MLTVLFVGIVCVWFVFVYLIFVAFPEDNPTIILTSIKTIKHAIYYRVETVWD